VLGLLVVLISAVTLSATLDAASPPPRRQTPAGSAALGASASSARTAAPSRAGAKRCGAATASTIASIDTVVARGIYAQELHSPEVSKDAAHVTGSAALLSALESNDQAAVREAVHAIVYTPHWHIVRLRVVKDGRVLADVGGPDVIAPVSGVLKLDGRTLASYVMSVQDDLGYEKLVSRFIDVPVDLYRGGALVMGTLQPAPRPVSKATTVELHGSSYLVEPLRAVAFPSGALGVLLFIPEPSPAVSSTSCASVALGAWGSIAMHIAGQLLPLQSHYQSLVDVLHATTGGPAYVRSGSMRIAGGRLPARIPARGLVKYGGRNWAVFSWEPVPPARVYFLTPTS
jgi:hypothetical protein